MRHYFLLQLLAVVYAVLTLPDNPFKIRVGPDFILLGDWSPGIMNLYSLSNDKKFQSLLDSIQVQTYNNGASDFEMVQNRDQWYAFQVSWTEGLKVIQINTSSVPYLSVCTSFPNVVGTSISVNYDHKFLYVLDISTVYRFDIMNPCQSQLLQTSFISISTKTISPYASALTNGNLLRIDGNNIGKVNIKSRNMTNETVWQHPEMPTYFRSVAGWGNIGYYAPEHDPSQPFSLYVVDLDTGDTIYTMPTTPDPLRPLIYSDSAIGLFNVNQYIVMVDRQELGSGKIIRVFDFTNATDPQFVMESSFANGTGNLYSDAFFAYGNVYAVGMQATEPIQDSAYSVFSNPNATVIDELMAFFKTRHQFKNDSLILINNQVFYKTSNLIPITTSQLKVVDRGMGYDFVPVQYQQLAFIKDDAFYFIVNGERRQWFLQQEIDQGLVSIQINQTRFRDSYYNVYFQVWNGRGSTLNVTISVVGSVGFNLNKIVIQFSDPEIPFTPLAISLTNPDYIVENIYYENPLTFVDVTQTTRITTKTIQEATVDLQFTPTLSANTDNSNKGNNFSTYATQFLQNNYLAFILAGCIFLLLILIVGICLLSQYRNKKRRKEMMEITEPTSSSLTSDTELVQSTYLSNLQKGLSVPSTTSSSSFGTTLQSSAKSSQNQRSHNLFATTTQTGTTTLEPTFTTDYNSSTLMVTQNVYSVPGYLCKNYSEILRNQKVINKGGQGVILLADLIDINLIEVAGEKIVVKSLNKSTEQLSEKEHNIFFQEIAIIHYFSQVSGFVRLFGFCESPACMLLKYYELGSMINLIRRKQFFKEFPITKRFMLSFLKKLTLTLQSLHQSGFVHCDLKPGNILLELEYNEICPILSDFGIAQVVESKVLKVKAMDIEQLKGFSVLYAAPEQIQQTRKLIMVPTHPKAMKARDSYAVAGLIYALFQRHDPWHEHH